MVVFCTTCKGRTQHLRKTLPRNLADNPGAGSKFVVLDYNSGDDLLDYLKTNHAGEITSGKLVVYSFLAPGPFRMAHAKNMAHRCGILEGGDILVNLDADNFTGPRFADYIAAQFQNATEEIFLWSFAQPGGRMRGVSGRIAVTARAFINAGGYDEQFETWSPDDKDFNARLCRMGYEPREIDAAYLGVILHNDKMRFREYPHARGGGYELFNSPTVPDKTVANFGKFGCGPVFKILAPRFMELRALPTRIFGIGLHKTGTTSLSRALQIMGYDSAHWKSAHWAKAIWQEMTSGGRSRTLERHYALSDLPIGILYRQLDAAYPGSKFILTTRAEDAWLRSVRNHWDPERNPFRAGWNNDPFTPRLHRELYGQRGFDAEIFLARYRRHNAEVRDYFRKRPGDLLVMDLERGGQLWRDLCAFLRRPIPDAEYPREFVTGMAALTSCEAKP